MSYTYISFGRLQRMLNLTLIKYPSSTSYHHSLLVLHLWGQNDVDLSRDGAIDVTDVPMTLGISHGIHEKQIIITVCLILL